MNRYLNIELKDELLRIRKTVETKHRFDDETLFIMFEAVYQIDLTFKRSAQRKKRNCSACIVSVRKQILNWYRHYDQNLTSIISGDSSINEKDYYIERLKELGLKVDKRKSLTTLKKEYEAITKHN